MDAERTSSWHKSQPSDFLVRAAVSVIQESGKRAVVKRLSEKSKGSKFIGKIRGFGSSLPDQFWDTRPVSAFYSASRRPS
jgi:hypothetical protein